MKKLWKRLSLQARLFLLLTALVITALSGGLVTVWHNDAIDSLLTSLIDKNVASFQAAEELENALLMQKGYLTYYFMDGNPIWLQQLGKYNQEFQDWLRKAQVSAYADSMRETLSQIEAKYKGYLLSREEVIALYKLGQRDAGAQRHWEVRKQFQEIFNLCDRYKYIHEQRIAQARSESQAQAHLINKLTLIAMPTMVVLGALLAYILIKQLLEPIRKLALDTDLANNYPQEPNEVMALSRRVKNLLKNVDQAQSELERSQEHLLQSEKLAMVGKLAAGVAHTIRNPLTSVKMRLFSMRRALNLHPDQQEDFDVISEEIRHIDTIVRNFLEFSRPPKLKMQRVSPSDVVDLALQLLRHRLESYNVEVKVIRPRHLPEICVDPDQLKEVLVNLLINACEAMVDGGLIEIKEEDNFLEPLGRMVVIQVSDNGPGIPESIQDKVFQPFFSGKEEGTGLGLSIASRILEEHGGWLDLKSTEGRGTTFIINLPFRKIKNGQDLNS
jgi:signal transduction histidine kinase